MQVQIYSFYATFTSLLMSESFLCFGKSAEGLYCNLNAGSPLQTFLTSLMMGGYDHLKRSPLVIAPSDSRAEKWHWEPFLPSFELGSACVLLLKYLLVFSFQGIMKLLLGSGHSYIYMF